MRYHTFCMLVLFVLAGGTEPQPLPTPHVMTPSTVSGSSDNSVGHQEQAPDEADAQTLWTKEASLKLLELVRAN